MAIEQALTILNWYENLPKDEIPPQHVWEDPKGLDEWWKVVEAKRDDGVPTSTASDDGDDEPYGDGAEMMGNELAREFARD